mmetsp:Transcript_49580/g.137713  ORF Transcript_49580/g.137713 Transcript_49580/m.137713 type:complete len:323 (-) Transcript_49580:26-994(-)
MVLLQLQEVEHIRVPRFQVHGEGALTLAPTLVHVARRLVEVPQHRHEAVAVAVRTPDVPALGAHIRDRDADAASRLGDERALLQGVVDAIDAVRLHCQQEAGRHLRRWSARVEQCWRRMRERPARHQVVGLHCRLQVSCMDADRNPHQHVLRPLHDLPMDSQQVRLLQGLEAEVVVVEIPLVVQRRVDGLGVARDELPDILGDQRRCPALLVVVVAQDAASLHETVRCGLVQVRNSDARGQDREVRMLLRHVRASLRGQDVDLRSRDARVQALDHLLRHGHRVHEALIQPDAERLYALRDVVELHGLLHALALRHEHRYKQP